MPLSINISEIFYKAFGYEMPEQEDFQIPDAAARKEFAASGASYYATDSQGREQFMPVTINGMLIPFAVISITSKKTIVGTPMPERGGTVHELISVDDYKINIKGLLINDNNDFPDTDVQALQDMFFKINTTVTMRSVLTDIFLNGKYDHNVIITDMHWPQIAGVEHVIPFEIACESDMAFELEVIN